MLSYSHDTAPATWDQHREMLAERAASSSDPDEESTVKPFNEFHAPLRLAAPEAIRGSPHPFSPPINIWAVGHLVSSATMHQQQQLSVLKPALRVVFLRWCARV